MLNSTNKEFGQAFNPIGLQPGSSIFGGAPTSAFGTPSSSPVFGVSSSPAFGNSPFGDTPISSSAFGTPSSSPVFGVSSSPAFGASSSPAFDASLSAVAQNNNQHNDPFEAKPSGTQASSTLFGAATSAPAFGASSSPAFGVSSSSVNGSSVFGSNPACGQSTSAYRSSPFGATSSSVSFAPSPLFGSSTSAVGSSPFGPASFGGKQYGITRQTPYSWTTVADNGSNTQPTGKLESISAMSAYIDKSHEELRWQDYQVGDKGGPIHAAQSSGGMGFKVTNTQQPNFWANKTSSPSFTDPFASRTSIFTASNIFESTQPTPSLFRPTPAFGYPTSGSPFAPPSSSAFGTSTSISSAQAQGKTSAFGTTGLNVGNTQSSTSAVGQTSYSFGHPASLFGKSIPAVGQSNVFGGNIFTSTPSLLSTSSMETTPSFTNPFSALLTQNTGGFVAPSGVTSSGFAQNNFAQPSASQSPFGRVSDKRAPMRISCRLTSRPLSQRQVGLPERNYHLNVEGLKVEEETTTITRTTPAFGQPSFGGQQRAGTRVTPYDQTLLAESGSQPYSGSQFVGRMESISAMPTYKEKSHEELKWEDYQLGDEGGVTLLINLLVDWSIV